MLMSLAAAVLIAVTAPTITVNPPQAPAPKSVADPALSASIAYAAKVCRVARLGGLVNARVVDDGDPSQPLPAPLGPWRIYCEHGILEVAWKVVK